MSSQCDMYVWSSKRGLRTRTIDETVHPLSADARLFCECHTLCQYLYRSENHGIAYELECMR
jgi:hypothetical protein